MPTSKDRPDRGAVRARIAAQQAAARRAERRRRLLWAAGAALAAGGIIAAIVLNLPASRSSSSPASPAPATTGTGPEGMALQNGQLLAPASTAATGQAVDGISCQATEQVAYHIHTHLAVYINGQLRPIPYGIGTVAPVPQSTSQGVFASASRCYYWLHTHVQDGVIHIESPTRALYTLGQFFDIWRQPLAADRIGPADGHVTAYVDGKPYTGDPRSITLQAHEDIQLDIGAPAVPPQPVDWTRSQL